MPTTRRVTIIAHELRGFRPAGGMGTATTFLALALARVGHTVEILLGKHDLSSLDDEWREVYANAGVRLRPVPAEEESVEPWHFLYAHRVALGVLEDPPDVVIAHDFGAPAYSALRMRQAGLGLDETLFVVFCHGTRRYVLDLSPNLAVGDLRTVLGVSVLEQAAVEVADVVVSPSAYLVEWMRQRGWQLPADTFVIPYLTRPGATGECPVLLPSRNDDQLRRLAFFGRVDERKGVRTFASALNELGPALGGLEVEFVGKTTTTWPRERVEALLHADTRRAMGALTFVTDLDQQAAVERIGREGTLVVLPSLQENSPNTVYECLEHGIPFIASDVGGVPELIAAEDRGRVLFRPTSRALTATLRTLLETGRLPTPASPAFDARTSLDAWERVLAMTPMRGSALEAPVDVDVVVHGERDKGTAALVLVLERDDVPDRRIVELLARVQRVSGADAVTCGVRLCEDDGTTRLHFFEGDPGGLGALGNAYGAAALVRREVLERLATAPAVEQDPQWPLLAELVASGNSIVSLPVALVERRPAPGTVSSDPAAALLAVDHLERTLPDPVRGAARIAAGLAAAAKPHVTTRSSRRRRRGWLR